jgi:hypothetical protein
MIYPFVIVSGACTGRKCRGVQVSEAILRYATWDCFVALRAPRNDEDTPLKRTERFGMPRPGTPESPWLGELDLTGYYIKT